MTLSSLGDSRMRCSDIKEKPSSRPPHPAKMKSKPTKIIMSLVGIVAVLAQGSTEGSQSV